MRRIILINAKGGCGKTTIATNLASCFAARGRVTALFDYDPQGSAQAWLTHRDIQRPSIFGVGVSESTPAGTTRAWQMRLPAETECIVMDTPAGMQPQDLLQQLRAADVVLVPVLPSPLDIRATANFVRDLLLVGKLRQYDTRIGIIANRVRRNTLSLQKLDRFLTRLDIPVVARLRDTQRYLHAADLGLGVHEMSGDGAYGDRVVWDAMADWIEGYQPPPLAESFNERLRSYRPA